MYQRYREFKEQFNASACGDANAPVRVDHAALQAFLESEYEQRTHIDADASYDTRFCVLADFPRKEVVELMQMYLDNPYTFAWGEGMYDIAKLFYVLWDENSMSWKDKPKHFPHDQIFECFLTLKQILREHRRHPTVGEAHTKRKQVSNSPAEGPLYRKCPRYPLWNLLGFYSLLGAEEGMEMVRHAATLDYEDAQEMLMFGLFQWPEAEFVPHLSWILQYWHAHQNMTISSTATGMAGQLRCLLLKYQRAGLYDALTTGMPADLVQELAIVLDDPADD